MEWEHLFYEESFGKGRKYKEVRQIVNNHDRNSIKIETDTEHFYIITQWMMISEKGKETIKL